MCMDILRAQRGIPLDEEALAAMPPELSDFWRGLMRRAAAEIRAAEAAGKSRPYRPSPNLAEQYRRAVGELAGGEYIPVKDIAQTFDFPL